MNENRLTIDRILCDGRGISADLVPSWSGSTTGDTRSSTHGRSASS